MIDKVIKCLIFYVSISLNMSAQVSATDPSISGWATNCVVHRGPMDVAQPSLGAASFGNDSNAIGAPSGSLDVVSLGDGGMALLTFSAPIKNVAGPDFAVFENGFSQSEGGPAYLEFAFVEVSSDGLHFVRFPATYSGQVTQQVSNADYVNASDYKNLAGKHTWGIGTAFDLEELKDSFNLNVNAVTHVRLVDVVGSIQAAYGSYDRYGQLINDPYPTPFPSGGFDLAGVAVLNQNTTTTATITKENEMIIYPIPTSRQIFVARKNGGSFYYQIVNLWGQTVQSGKIEDRQNIDVTRLSAGVYTLVVEKENAKEYHKFEKL